MKQIKKCTKSITTYEFSTFYAKLSHDKLKNKVSSIIDLAPERRSKNYNKLSTHDIAHWAKKTNGV